MSINRLSSFNIFIHSSLLVHSKIFSLVFNYEWFMISWSLLTIHTIPAIALQFLQGSDNNQQRPFTSIT